jgi:hypothetical protein
MVDEGSGMIVKFDPDAHGAGSSGLAFTPATLLPGGKVLISSESAAELYHPTSNAFSLTARMITVFSL